MNPLRHNVIPLEFVRHDERRNPEQDVIDEIDELVNQQLCQSDSGGGYVRCKVSGTVCQVNTDV